MKGLFSKVMVVIAGAIALFGFSAGNVTASVPSLDLSYKAPLYLEHGKTINHAVNLAYDDDGHSSHSSHESHSSHSSHDSHSSGY